MSNRSLLFILTLIIVFIGGFFRVYRLDEFPPSRFTDEAYIGFDALRLVQTLHVPVFYAGNNGREPLTIYLVAAGIFLWGAQPWVLRVVPALIGTITLPFVYQVGFTLFREEKRAKWVGALAMGMLAVSFWHVELSRLTFSAISLPLFSAITILYFWRAWQGGRLLHFALGGIALGVTLYSYLASRLLPLVLAGFVITISILTFLRRSRAIAYRRIFTGLAIMLVTALIVFAPLGFYFLQNPSEFFMRANQISIFSGSAQGFPSLRYNALATLRMFVDRGDLDVRHNLPGRPALDVISTIGFWVGLAIAIKQVATPRYLLLLIWLGANLAATLLSDEAPHFLRAAGALPPIVILAADGLTRVWERVAPNRGWTPLVVGTIAFSAALTYYDYFEVWGPSRETFVAFDSAVDTVFGSSTETIVERALTLSQTTDVILPASIYGMPNLQFHLAKRFGSNIPTTVQRSIHSATAIAARDVERGIVLLRNDGVFVPQPLDDAQTARLSELMLKGQPIRNKFGERVGTELALDHPAEFIADLKPAHPVDANFSGQIKMFAYDLEATTIQPGELIRITYYWQALRDLNSDLLVTSVILDPTGKSFGQRIAEPLSGKFPTSLWLRGTIVPDSFLMRVPADAHPGKYRIEVGLLHREATDLLIPKLGTEDRLLLDPFTVANTPVNLAIANPLGIKFGGPVEITGLGYDLGETEPRAGENLKMTLFWRDERSIAKDYSVFVHLVDAEGRIRVQEDGQPEGGNAPTSWWRPGDMISDVRQLSLPSDLSTGKYELQFGVYDPATGIRLPLFNSTGMRQPGDLWQIQIQIAGD